MHITQENLRKRFASGNLRGNEGSSTQPSFLCKRPEIVGQHKCRSGACCISLLISPRFGSQTCPACSVLASTWLLYLLNDFKNISYHCYTDDASMLPFHWTCQHCRSFRPTCARLVLIGFIHLYCLNCPNLFCIIRHFVIFMHVIWPLWFIVTCSSLCVIKPLASCLPADCLIVSTCVSVCLVPFIRNFAYLVIFVGPRKVFSA